MVPRIFRIASHSPRDRIYYINFILIIAAFGSLVAYSSINLPAEEATRTSTRELQQQTESIQTRQFNCHDTDERCHVWHQEGECDRNVGFMLSACRQSCDACPLFMHNVPETVKLLSGREMPRVGFGTAGLGQKETLTAVQQAIQAGYRKFDTAEAKEWYREDLVGKAIIESGLPRQDFFITSKIMPRDYGKQSILDTLDHILDELKTTYVDMLLLHYPSCWGTLCTSNKKDEQQENKPPGTWQESYRSLEAHALKPDGRIRCLGVSNFNVEELAELLRIARTKPCLVQTNSEPFKPSQDIQAFCTRHGIQFESYSTLGGQYTAGWGKQSPVLTHPTVIRLAEKYHRHPSQIILRWALQHGSTVIPRSKDALHQAQNLRVFDFDLTDQDLLSIDSLSQHT